MSENQIYRWLSIENQRKSHNEYTNKESIYVMDIKFPKRHLQKPLTFYKSITNKTSLKSTRFHLYNNKKQSSWNYKTTIWIGH